MASFDAAVSEEGESFLVTGSGLQEALKTLEAGEFTPGLRQLIKQSDNAKGALLEVLSELITSEIAEASLSPMPLLGEFSASGLDSFNWDRVLGAYENLCPLLLACLRTALATKQGQAGFTRDQARADSVKPAIGVILSLIFYMSAPERFKIKNHVEALVSWLPRWEKQTKSPRMTRSATAISPEPQHVTPAKQRRTATPKRKRGRPALSKAPRETKNFYGTNVIDGMEMTVTDDQMAETSVTLLSAMKQDMDSDDIQISVKEEPLADQSESLEQPDQSESMLEEDYPDNDNSSDVSDAGQQELLEAEDSDGDYPGGDSPGGDDPDGELVELGEGSSQQTETKKKTQSESPCVVTEPGVISVDSNSPLVMTGSGGTQWVTVGDLALELDAETMNSNNIIVVLEEADGDTTLAIPDQDGTYSYPTVTIPADGALDYPEMTIAADGSSYMQPAVTITSDGTIIKAEGLVSSATLLASGDDDNLALEASVLEEINQTPMVVTFKDGSSVDVTASTSFQDIPTVTSVIKSEQSAANIRNAKLGNFSCNFCLKTFSRLDNLKRHVKTHEGGYKHKCDVCGKILRDATMLKDHVSIEHGDGKLHCDQCFKSFRSRNGLQTHLILHKDQFKYVCDICGQGFVHKNLLEGHTNSKHQNIKPHICQNCGRGFAWLANYTTHKKSCAPDVRMRRVACSMCDSLLKNEASLARHMLSHKNKDVYRCPKCDKRYSHRNSLKDHIRKCKL